MPERKCTGCLRQEEWGCEAYRVPSSTEDRQAIPNAKGKWWRWHKPARMPLMVDGEETYACPRQDLLQRGAVWNQMLLYYGYFKKGHLPQACAVMDQSNKAMEVFRIIDDASAEADQALLDKDKARAARAQAHAAAGGTGRNGRAR